MTRTPAAAAISQAGRPWSSPARRMIRPWLYPLRSWSLAMRVLAAAHASPHPVAIFYGSPRVPPPGAEAWGGLVKYQVLQQRFPHSPRRFNLCYLVSSAVMPWTMPAIRLAQRRGAKLVWNQNGVAYPAWHGPGWEAINAPMAEALRVADHVVYQSRFCQRTAERFLGRRAGPAEILYNPVDTARLTPAPPRALAEDMVLLLGGTQTLEYRVAAAIATLALVRRHRPAARLLIGGQLRWGADPKAARRRAEQLCAEADVAGAVEFLGPYAQAQAPELFRRAHILLHTKYNDPSPTVVLEAMACGLPVVYSASGGVPELVGEHAGLGVAPPASAQDDWEHDYPPEPEALAQAALAIAGEYDRYARAARQRAVERFDVHPWLERHRQIFAEVLAGC